MAFYQLEPWGCEIEDWRAGMIAATIANVNRDPKKQRKPYEPQDFMPKRGADTTEEQSVEEMERVLKMWETVLGGSQGNVRGQ